jgi:hypothetical protein
MGGSCYRIRSTLSTLYVSTPDLNNHAYSRPTPAEVAARYSEMVELRHISYICKDDDTSDDNDDGYRFTGYDSPYEFDDELEIPFGYGSSDNSDEDIGLQFEHNDHNYPSTTDDGEQQMFARRDAKEE